MSRNLYLNDVNDVKKNYTDLRNISDGLNVKTSQPKLPGNQKHSGKLQESDKLERDPEAEQYE